MPSDTYSPPPIGASGILVATYTGIIVSGVAAYAVTDKGWAAAYVVSALAAIAATVGMQWGLSLLLSNRATTYTYSYDTRSGVQRIVESSIGVIPGTQNTWDMPGSAAQLTSFAAAYWTAYISKENAKGDEEDHPFWHSAALWVMSYLLTMISLMYGYNTLEQSMFGVVGGGMIGYVAYRVSEGAI